MRECCQASSKVSQGCSRATAVVGRSAGQRGADIAPQRGALPRSDLPQPPIDRSSLPASSNARSAPCCILTPLPARLVTLPPQRADDVNVRSRRGGGHDCLHVTRARALVRKRFARRSADGLGRSLGRLSGFGRRLYDTSRPQHAFAAEGGAPIAGDAPAFASCRSASGHAAAQVTQQH